MVYETKHPDGTVVQIKDTQQCCGTCEYSSLHQDSSGCCSLLEEWTDGKRDMIDQWIPSCDQVDGGPEYKSVIDRPVIGAAMVCEYWKKDESK